MAKDPVLEESTESESDNEFIDFDNDADYAGYSGEPNRYYQDDLSDLIRDLNLEIWAAGVAPKGKKFASRRDKGDVLSG